LDGNEFKRSESGFDTNKTNPFLSISIHFRLLDKTKIIDHCPQSQMEMFPIKIKIF